MINRFLLSVFVVLSSQYAVCADQIRGVVLHHDGKPVPFARIWLDVSDATSEITANRIGEFEFDESRYKPAKYYSGLWAYGSGQVARTQIRDGKATIKLSKPKPTKIRVLDWDGTPVKGARVSATRVFAASTTGFPIPNIVNRQTGVVTDEDGRTELQTDPMTLKVSRPDYADQQFHFAKGEIKLRQTGTIRGRLIGPRPKGKVSFEAKTREVNVTKRKLEDGSIEHVDHITIVADAIGKYKVHSHAGIRIDQDGKFELKGWPVGELHWFWARYDKNQSLQLDVPVGVAIKPNAVTDLEVPVRNSIPITGRIVDESGQPVSGIELFCTLKRHKVPIVRIETDKDGRFKIFDWRTDASRLVGTLRVKNDEGEILKTWIQEWNFTLTKNDPQIQMGELKWSPKIR